MTVAEYRNEIDHLNSIVRDRYACVGDKEKSAWYFRAIAARNHGYAIASDCKRLKAEDKQNMLGALARLTEGIDKVAPIVGVV